MVRSTTRNTRPKDMLRYLLMMAATISVPPVEPLKASPKPIPLPMNTPPMMEVMKGSPSNRWMLSRCSWKTAESAVSNDTA